MSVEILNSLAANWARHMTAALADSALILLVAAAIWWLVRQRASAQFGYWLFLLVLVRLLVPIELTVPAWIAPLSLKQLLNRTANRTLPHAEAASLQSSTSGSYAPPPAPRWGASGAPLAYQPPYFHWQSPLDHAPRVAMAQSGAPPAALSPTAPLAGSPLAQLSWPSVLGLAWLAIALVLLARMIVIQRRTRRLLRSGKPLDPADLPLNLEDLVAAARLDRAPQILVADVASPAVVGIFQPRLLVPPDLLNFAPRQMTWILLRELAHIRRHDVLVAMFQRLLQVFYFFNPAVWLTNWAADQLREYACDDAALAACDTSRRDCGEGFLNVALRASGHPMLSATPTSLLNRNSFIHKRLVRILDNKRKVQVGLSAGAIALLLLLAAFMIPTIHAAESDENLVAQEAAAQSAVPPPASGDAETDNAPTDPNDASPQDSTAAKPNLTWQKFPAEFADYYTTQRILANPAEPQPFCKSSKPLQIDPHPTFGMNAVLDESGGTGTGYDTLYIDMDGDGDFSNDPVYKVSPQDRKTGLEGHALVSYFDNVNIPRGADSVDQAGSAHVQMFLEQNPDRIEGSEYLLNMIPAQWAVGTIQVNGQATPVAMVDGTFNDSAVNRLGMRPYYLNSMSPGDDAGVVRSDFLIIGKPGETALQPGDPNGWLGKTGSARSMNTQFLVTDSGMFEIQADQTDQGVNLQMVPANVPTSTVDISQVPHNARLAMFGTNACVLLDNPGNVVQVPGDTYYIPTFGPYMLEAPAGGAVTVTPPKDLDIWAPKGFNSVMDRDQTLFTAMEPPGGQLGTTDAVRWAQPETNPFAFSNRRTGWRTIEVLVVAEDTNRGISGAAVNVDSYASGGRFGGGYGSRKLVTSTDGSCTIYVPAGANLIRANAEAAGYVPTSMQWNAGSSESLPQQYTWILSRGTPIGGVVRNERGQPVAGARVMILAAAGGYQPGKPSAALESLKVQTDKRGTWRCDQAPAQLTQVRIGLTHADYMSDWYPNRTASVDELRSMTAEFVMKEGIALTGKVTGPKGKPVAEAIINYGNYNTTKTNPQGRYRVRNLAPGRVNITARAPGCAPEQKRVTIEEKMRPVDFKLHPGNTIKARLVDQGGNSITLAEVYFRSWQGTNNIFWHSKTDAEGRWCWNEAPADEVVFRISAQGYMPLESVRLTASREEQIITIRSQLQVTGCVTDAATGQMLSSFKVTPGASWRIPGLYRWQESGSISGSNGTFSMRIDQPSNQYCLRVEAPGYLPAVSKPFAGADGDQNLDIKLRRDNTR